MMKENIRLQELLVTLRTRLLVMCAETSIALENAQQALVNKDIAKASSVIEGDASINALENEIDDRALCIMIRTQPMATDLRFVIGALRIVSDLERICDEAVSISEHVLLMKDMEQAKCMDSIFSFFKSARQAVDATFEAFRNNDAAKAKELSSGDSDALQEEVRILQILMDHISKKDSNPEDSIDPELAMHLILIIHSITRIWRRSVNFAEQIYFCLEGVSLKHAENKAEQ